MLCYTTWTSSSRCLIGCYSLFTNIQYSRHFLYSSPALPLGPEDLTWRMVSWISVCKQSILCLIFSNFSLQIFPSFCFECSKILQIAGKLLNIKLHIRRSQHLVEGSRNICTCECRHSNTTRASWSVFSFCLFECKMPFFLSVAFTSYILQQAVLWNLVSTDACNSSLDNGLLNIFEGKVTLKVT